jgi:hypothetical protein
MKDLIKDEDLAFYRGYLEEAKRNGLPEESQEDLNEFLSWFLPLRNARDQWQQLSDGE